MPLVGNLGAEGQNLGQVINGPLLQVTGQGRVPPAARAGLHRLQDEARDPVRRQPAHGPGGGRVGRGRAGVREPPVVAQNAAPVEDPERALLRARAGRARVRRVTAVPAGVGAESGRRRAGGGHSLLALHRRPRGRCAAVAVRSPSCAKTGLGPGRGSYNRIGAAIPPLATATRMGLVAHCGPATAAAGLRSDSCCSGPLEKGASTKGRDMCP